MPYVRKKDQRNASTQTFGTSVSKKVYTRKPRHKFRRRKGNKKLLDKKINTAVEFRMQQIAKKEVEKNRALLTLRQYLYVDYNLITNTFNVLGTRYDLIDYDGIVTEISAIPKTDVETRTNVPRADNPHTAFNENTGDNDGANQLMVGDPINGYRWGDVVHVQSVSAQIRLRSFQLTDSDMDLFQLIKVKYAIVLVEQDQDIMDDVAEVPECNQMLRINPWGFMGAKLDRDLQITFSSLKKRVLCQGETTLNLTDIQTSEKFTTIYKKFPKSIPLHFLPTSQNGQKCDKKIYFCAVSSVPAHSDYNDIKPSLFACVKLNYYEA